MSVGERPVEVLGLVDDADPEVRIRVLRELGARDRADALAGLAVAEADELGEVVLPKSVTSCSSRSYGSSRRRRAAQPGQALAEPLGVADAALLPAVARGRLHLLDDVDAVVVAQPDELLSCASSMAAFVSITSLTSTYSVGHEAEPGDRVHVVDRRDRDRGAGAPSRGAAKVA